MPQLENNVMELASLFMAAINPGILSYTVALVVVVGFSLSTILSPFTPGAMVKTLNKTVEKTYADYDEHKDMPDGSAAFEDKVNRIRVEAVRLEVKHLQAYNDMSLVDLRSWRRYIWEAKDIWVKARQRQREIVKLRKALKLAIVRARRDKLEAALGHHGQEREETTGNEELDGTSVV